MSAQEVSPPVATCAMGPWAATPARVGPLTGAKFAPPACPCVLSPQHSTSPIVAPMFACAPQAWARPIATDSNPGATVTTPPSRPVEAAGLKIPHPSSAGAGLLTMAQPPPLPTAAIVTDASGFVYKSIADGW